MHEGTAQTINKRPHALYRMYDAEAALLYVGITCNPSRRFEKHLNDKPWWSEVARIELEQHPDRDSVLQAEREAIIGEKPRHNIRHANGRPHDPATNRALSSPEIDGLVGRFFHSWREPCASDSEHVTVRAGLVLEWQGRVVDRELSDLFIIELFSWLDGFPNGQRLVGSEEMRTWTFYDSALEMQCGLGCRESGKRWLGRDGLCGAACTHVADAIGVTTVCSSCADAYTFVAEIIWRDGKPDESATLAALRKAARK